MQKAYTDSGSHSLNADSISTHLSLRSPARWLRVMDMGIFCSLLAVILLTAIPYGSVEPWWEAAFECLIFALLGLWVCEGIARRGDESAGVWPAWRAARRGMFLPLLAILVYAILQTIHLRGAGIQWPAISADPYTTRLLALKLFALLSAGLLLARYTSSRRRLSALIYVLLVTAVASALFGIIRETTQHNAPGFVLPQLMPGAGYAQFINRNHFAYLMEMGLGLAFGMILGNGENRGRLIYIASTLPMLVSLALANSRGGIMSLLSQAIFLLLIYGVLSARKKTSQREEGTIGGLAALMGWLPVRILLVLCLLGALVVGVFWVGGDPLAKRLESIKSEVTTEDTDTGEGGHRREIWRATWKMFRDHPVTGIGFGGYWVAITGYYDVPGQKRPYQAHNDYLELLVSGGLIGALLGAWFLIALLVRVRSTLQTKDTYRRSACLAALTGLFGIAVHSIVDFGLHITINALVCVALIVIATIDVRVDAPGHSPARSSVRRRRTREIG